MKTIMLALFTIGLCSCNGPEDTGWTKVGTEAPQNSPIFKKHDDKEHVTFYATRSYGGHWIVSAVKD